METHAKTEKTPARDLFLRTVAVLGLIAILLLGAWGIIQLAFAIPTVFENLGGSVTSLFTHTPGSTNTATNSGKETITVTMPSTAMSGQSIQVAWTHKNADTSGQYSYAISFACEDNLTVKAPLPNGSFETVPCNTLFNYVNASSHMTIMPTLTGTAHQPLTVTVTATKLATGASTASGTATTNIAPGAATATKPATTTAKPTTTTAKPSTTYYPAATRTTNLYGYGDLAVTITSVAPSAGATTVKFTIANVGTNVVNSGWTFNATLPINGSYAFGSQPQQALYPGDKIAYTLTFDAGQNYGQGYYPYGYPATGYSASGYTCNGYTCNNNNVITNYPYGTYGYGYGYQYPSAAVTITADPSNFVPEYNKNNNIAQTSVAIY